MSIVKKVIIYDHAVGSALWQHICEQFKVSPHTHSLTLEIKGYGFSDVLGDPVITQLNPAKDHIIVIN